MHKGPPQITTVVGILMLWQDCMFLLLGDLNGFLIRAETYNAFSSTTKKSGIKSNIKPPPPPATVILDSHTFDDVVLVSSLATFLLSGSRLGSLVEQRS